MYVMTDNVTAKTTTQWRARVGRVLERCIMGANDLDLWRVNQAAESLVARQDYFKSFGSGLILEA
jgi:hypothetical protein